MSAAPTLTAAWVSVLEPPPELTVSEWAERYRVLPDASAARGGRWRNATAPYLAGIMDAARDPAVRKIALCKSHQSGGSEAINNIVAFHVQHDPCPMLVVHPTHMAAEAFSKERLADMIRSTPALAAVVRDRTQPRGAHQAESTLALKMFPGGFIALGGANTPNTFARWSARLAIGDDVDRFPADVGEEGDPADLLVNRTTSFFDALSVFVSTPKLKGGRIDTMYSRSDQRRYFVPCLRCGHQDHVTWNDPEHFRVGYDDEDPQSARLECPNCEARILEPERRAMVARGEWRATREPDDPGLAGFHLPAMISTLGDVTLPGLVSKWLSARARGKQALQAFINTWLAEGWEDRGARIEPHALLHRRELYGEGVEVPGDAPCLTAGVDVQLDRFELQVIAWGLAGERWVVDWRVVPGDPKKPETHAALLEALGVRYRHASGHLLPVHATCIDSGYLPEQIYGLSMRNRHRRIYATKGIGNRRDEPVILNAITKVPINVNVDGAKADIYGSLSLVTPGPGYTHFPERVDEEYFSQLCAEHEETRRNKAGIATHTAWVPHRERNEALDTAVLALAAFRILVGRAENERIRSMAEVLAATPVPGDAGSSGPPPADPPQPRERRVKRWTPPR